MKIFLFLLILIAGAAAFGYLYQDEILPVREVQIDGETQHIDMQLVQETLVPYIQQGLLRANVSSMQQSLLTLPWVAKARVSRVWPDTIHVWLAEPEAVALWANDGVVSHQGKVFYIKTLDTQNGNNLPVFEGLEGQAGIMLENYQQMLVILKPLNFTIKRLVLTPRNAWEIELNNNIRLFLGQNEVMERLQRFVDAYPKLSAESEVPIEYVDLRYPNGLAVKRIGTVASNG